MLNDFLMGGIIGLAVAVLVAVIPCAWIGSGHGERR